MNEQFQVENDFTENSFSIGSLLINLFNEMLPTYRRFCCQNTVKLISTINSKLYLLTKLSKIIVDCNRGKQYDETLLLLPLKHILKYQLLIENLIEFSSSDNEDYNQCQEARNLSKLICKEINEAYDKSCKEWHPIQKLDWVQKHIFIPNGRLDQPIVFNSQTQFSSMNMILSMQFFYNIITQISFE